jgi:MFS family permease
MAGGPAAAAGPVIGDHGSKNKVAGILMVCSLHSPFASHDKHAHLLSSRRTLPCVLSSCAACSNPFWLLSAFAAFGGILYGYDTGVINGLLAMNEWLCTFGQEGQSSLSVPMHTCLLRPDASCFLVDGTCTISTGRKSLVVSILSAGTFCGALLGAPMADFAGRKWGIIFSCLVFSVGVAMQTASTAMALFIVGRVIAGLGVGLVSVLVPMYQSEW